MHIRLAIYIFVGHIQNNRACLLRLLVYLSKCLFVNVYHWIVLQCTILNVTAFLNRERASKEKQRKKQIVKTLRVLFRFVCAFHTDIHSIHIQKGSWPIILHVFHRDNCEVIEFFIVCTIYLHFRVCFVLHSQTRL